METIKTVQKQREFFKQGNTLDVNTRIEYLKKLKSKISDYSTEICEALYKDLNKHETEAFLTEVGIVLDELSTIIKNIKKWSKPKRAKTPIHSFPATTKVYKDPYGVVLVMAPWNYPFQLLMNPLAGAIAAGNVVVAKPGAAAVHTSKIIEKILSEVFPKEYVSVHLGGREVITEVLKEKYDYIFFTGGEVLGTIVAKKAAENLTPTTLELGGKSPCIICADADLKLAAKRAAWAKLVNNGQTCIAPDYFLVDNKIKDNFIVLVKYYIEQFYTKNPAESSSYGRLISDKHFEKVTRNLENQNIIYGGNFNKEEKYLSPTIILEPALDSSVMSEEIFGPIFPIVGFDKIDEIENLVNNRNKPLALYLFTNDKKLQKRLLKNVTFGGGCINDLLMHVANNNAPFGGVGNSGMGNYHGKYSFETFSHTKSVYKGSTKIDLKFRYPSYTKKALKLAKLFLK